MGRRAPLPRDRTSQGVMPNRSGLPLLRAMGVPSVGHPDAGLTHWPSAPLSKSSCESRDERLRTAGIRRRLRESTDVGTNPIADGHREPLAGGHGTP
jgi:hypothetical protein